MRFKARAHIAYQPGKRNQIRHTIYADEHLVCLSVPKRFNREPRKPREFGKYVPVCPSVSAGVNLYDTERRRLGKAKVCPSVSGMGG